MTRAMPKSTARLTLRTMYDAVNYLILNPEHQTTGCMARDGSGKPVAPTDPAACQWCALGRIAHDLNISVRSIPLAPFSGLGIAHIPLDYKLDDRRLTDEMRKQCLRPLDLSASFFVQRNDRADPEKRQKGLEEITTTLLAHPAFFHGD